MSLLFRGILFIGSLYSLLFMMHRIRKSKLEIKDSIFWIILLAILVLLSIFPRIAVYVANVLDIISPANMVFLVIIFLLLVKVFNLCLQISAMDMKIKKLAQLYALHTKERTNELNNIDSIEEN